MNLIAHPELLELLAASHALGTLRGGARRRFETLAREQAPVRAAALVWQGRLASMTELQSPVVPDPAVWTRIRNIIDAEQSALALERQRDAARAAGEAGQGGWLRSLALWRGAALRLTASESDVQAVPALAISLEAKGGVPPGSGPKGPILFKGALIEKTL